MEKKLEKYLKKEWQELWEKYRYEATPEAPTDMMFYEQFAEAITHHNHTLLTLLGEEMEARQPEHICRFNDGDCKCPCYLEVVEDVKSLINNLITQDEEQDQPCPHGRPGYQSCPHCLGLNNLT